MKTKTTRPPNIIANKVRASLAIRPNRKSNQLVQRQPKRTPVIVIDNQAPRQTRTQTRTQTRVLSALVAEGAKYNPACKDSTLEIIEIGYYHYDRRIEIRTDALMCAYVALNPGLAVAVSAVCSPSRSNLITSFPSESQIIWTLGQAVGYDLTKVYVQTPLGKSQSVADAMISLIDEGWTRTGVANWLASVGL